MKTILNALKNDLLHVFVEGNAKSQELAHVFTLIAIPVMSAVFIISHLHKF